MTHDISDILNEWPYDPEANVRVVEGRDGTMKIQARLPFGIEQYEMDDRPDGKRPVNRESMLDYYYEQMREYCSENGNDKGFSLDAEACSELHTEGLLYYHRYVLLFQLGDYERTIRDVERNRRMFDFVKKYADEPEQVNRLETYRPYIIRMGRIAGALKCAGEGDFDRAEAFVKMGLREIQALEEIDNEVFRFEKTRSMNLLRKVRNDISMRRPASETDRLRQGIKHAVAEENYEKAAELRDRLRDIQQETEEGTSE